MNDYLKLVNFELNRFIKIYAALLAITIVSQFIGVAVESKSYLKQVENTMLKEAITKAQYISQYRQLDFSQILNSFWFLVPIAISAAALIFYIFLIWYRDWFGKNTFIYRLLMLPTSRLHIYFAKATAIFLMVLGLVAVQIAILPLENSLYQMLVPDDLNYVTSMKIIINNHPFLMIIIPNTFIQFLLYYGLGFTVVFTLFTAILIERSYRLKGVVMGLMYCVAAGAIFLSPLLLTEFFPDQVFLYPKELLALESVLGLLVMAGSIWMSHFLLYKKVTV